MLSADPTRVIRCAWRWRRRWAISKIVIKDNHPRRSMPRNGVHPHKKFEGIYLIGGAGEERLCTRSLAPGENVYGEEIAKVRDLEHRIWDPLRRKPAAAILKGPHKIPIVVEA